MDPRRRRAAAAAAPELDAEEESFYDYTVLPWFTVPRETGRRHVTGPYVDWLCTQEYTLTFTVPVFGTHPERGRCHLGVVGADIVAGWLERRLLPLLHRMDGPVGAGQRRGPGGGGEPARAGDGGGAAPGRRPGAVAPRAGEPRDRGRAPCTACRTCRSGCWSSRREPGQPSADSAPCASVMRRRTSSMSRAFDLADEVFQGRGRQRAGLGVEDDPVADGHHGGDGGDAERLRDLDLGLGVDLAERDVAVPFRGLLEHGRELPAGAAPRRPEVDEHGAGGVDDVREVLGGQLDGGHAGCNHRCPAGVPTVLRATRRSGRGPADPSSSRSARTPAGARWWPAA